MSVVGFEESRAVAAVVTARGGKKTRVKAERERDGGRSCT